MNLPLSRFIDIKGSEERLETMRGPYLLETRLRLVKLSLYRALPTMGRPSWQIGKLIGLIRQKFGQEVAGPRLFADFKASRAHPPKAQFEATTEQRMSEDDYDSCTAG